MLLLIRFVTACIIASSIDQLISLILLASIFENNRFPFPINGPIFMGRIVRTVLGTSPSFLKWRNGSMMID